MSTDVRALLRSMSIKFKEPTDKLSPWLNVICPFCQDHKETLSNSKAGVNIKTATFSCFKCKANGENVADITVYLSATTGMSLAKVKAHVSNIFGTSKVGIPIETLNSWQGLLLRSPDELSKLHMKGLNIDTITRMGIGLQPDGRFSIPVFDKNGELVNVRRYKQGNEVKYLNTKGMEDRSIYNPWNLNEDIIIITEGELKAGLLEQYGFPAVSPTCGARQWKPEWDILFTNKVVYVVYDVDETGQNSAHRICKRLVLKARAVYNVILDDVRSYKGGDIENFFVDERKGPDDFLLKLKNAPKYVPREVATVGTANNFTTDDVEAPISVPLANATMSDYFLKKITTAMVVSAKDTVPYIVPKKVSCNCPRQGEDWCIVCPVAHKNRTSVEIRSDHPVLVELINTSHKGQEGPLRGLFGIPKQCKSCKFDIDTSYNIEEVRAIPQISIGHSAAEGVIRKVLYVGHGIETNTPYQIDARVVTDPSNQHAVLLAYGAEKNVDDIDTFELSQDLTLFQPGEDSYAGVEAKLNDIYFDLENNVTGIFDRRDLHIFVDLIFHSCLYVPFQGKVEKGWVDALIIGDSGQGKSATSNALLKHYRHGERIDTKRASVAGLVGGLQDSGGRWFLTWGSIPLNDRRMVILEEVKGAPQEVLQSLTDMRSSGIAEIVKIEKAKTNARTRLLWITNPRSDRGIGEYNHGVEAIKELMGSLEDIRRYDMAMAVASGQVEMRVINGGRKDNDCKHYYTTDLCSHLVGWAWSRKPENIQFEEGCESLVLDKAMEMGRMYSSACPLVEPSDQRLKICRLACALAARLFSTMDGTNLIIRKAHVEYVVNFLHRIYANPALGYKEYSAAQNSESELRNTEELKLSILKMPNAKDLVSAMLDVPSFSWNDIADYTELDQETCTKFIGTLARCSAVRRLRRGGYRKTKAFIEWLKALDRSGELMNSTGKMEGEV